MLNRKENNSTFDRSAHKGQRPTPIVRRDARSAASEGCDSVRTRYGGAERDRTADPLLAKQVLSQLSYSPNSQKRSSGTAYSRQASAQSPFINTITRTR